MDGAAPEQKRSAAKSAFVDLKKNFM